MSGRYFAPASIAEAVELLDREEGAAVVAGGTDLVVAARAGRRPWPETLVAVHRVQELRGIEETPGGGLRLGALVTHAELEASDLVRARFASLADAAALVGSPATRHAGTVGGNLVNASPAMELGSPLLVHAAGVKLASASGVRRLALADFLAGPGSTAAEAGELLVAVELPAPPARSASAYVRLDYRRAMEIAVAGAACLLALEDGVVAEARIALTAVAPTCVRASAAEAALAGAEPSPEALARAAALAVESASPISDVRASAGYRRAQVAVVVRRALEAALGRVPE